MTLTFPKPLQDILANSPLFAAIRAYADQAGHILTDNKLDFFPDYTDHGTEHINRVLAAEVELIPAAVWQRNPPAFTDKDAAVLIGATLLHDIAMHLRPAGFLELVSADSRFKPLPWFNKEQQGHKADRPWRDLWLDYEREAKRFSDRKLADIIGPHSVRDGWTFNGLPKDSGEWQHNHKLVLGEFIRRHHARLAHEIAHYGFPGLEPGAGVDQFAALAAPGHPLRDPADLIGLAARSHGMNLRVCQAYLNSRHPRSPRPLGCAVLYPMALLRVADYLQIDRQRTPPALLKLRDPQSPISLQEWQKHLAVLSIDPADDPRGLMVTVSRDVSHAVYLQLRELLAGLQAEMDHATAVLDEAYGTRKDLGLDELSLATRRVHSNLDEPSFRDELPYVPERTGYSTDPNLLTLLVEPLYGKEPGVGVRELMQNSVDAVRELHAWCEAHGKRVDDLDLPDQEADVLIDFIQREDGSWFLRCTDKGIGMTADTLQNYFLRAGASFRNSPEWTKEFVDDEGKPKVLRAGRFGIGAFAIFLLGPRFRLWTRHVTADEGQGYYLEAEGDSRRIVLDRKNCLKVGTILEVDISFESAKMLDLVKVKNKNISYRPPKDIDWYCQDWPTVIMQVTKETTTKVLAQSSVMPLHAKKLPPEWSIIHPPGFDAVYWTFDNHPKLVCNGIKIADPNQSIFKAPIYWPETIQMERPKIAILDGGANFPLTIQRYSFAGNRLPFVAELSRDVTLSFIAHALVCGPTSRMEAHSLEGQFKLHPLVSNNRMGRDAFHYSLLRWCSSCCAVIPVDSWLYSLLKTDTCLIFGSFSIELSQPQRDRPQAKQLFNTLLQAQKDSAILTWNGYCDMDFGYLDDYDDGLREFHRLESTFSGLIKNGFQFLRQHSIDIHLILSCLGGIPVQYMPQKFGKHRLKWHEITPSNAYRKYFESQTAILSKFLAADKIIQSIESVDFLHDILLGVIYIIGIRTHKDNPKPKTLLAKLWNECLGPNPIPFDPVARQALIERGRQHPELRRHIEAWEEMKRTGSKWVYGDGD